MSQIHWDEFARSVWDHSVVGLVYVDLQGIMLDVNPEFCQMLGFARHELIGHHFKDITHLADQNIGVAEFKEIIDGQRDMFGPWEKRYKHKSEEWRWHAITCSVVKKNGKIVAVATQITPLHRNNIKNGGRNIQNTLALLREFKTWNWWGILRWLLAVGVSVGIVRYHEILEVLHILPKP